MKWINDNEKGDAKDNKSNNGNVKGEEVNY